jgi:hypothetical protein
MCSIYMHTSGRAPMACSVPASSSESRIERVAREAILPRPSPLIEFAAGRREEILEGWAQAIRRSGIRSRYDAERSAASSSS